MERVLYLLYKEGAMQKSEIEKKLFIRHDESYDLLATLTTRKLITEIAKNLYSITKIGSGMMQEMEYLKEQHFNSKRINPKQDHSDRENGLLEENRLLRSKVQLLESKVQALQNEVEFLTNQYKKVSPKTYI